MDKTEYILSMLMEMPPDFEKIEQELKKQDYTTEEITLAACKFAEECQFEGEYCREKNTKIRRKMKRHSPYLYKACELLLKYGLDPNLVLGERLSETNIMHELLWIDNGSVAAETLKLLLDNGGDLKLKVDDETLFEFVDFDIIYYVSECVDKEKYDSRFKMWILMIGYGALAGKGVCPVKLINQYPVENFKDFEKFTYKIVTSNNDWIMYIYDKEKNDLVAWL